MNQQQGTHVQGCDGVRQTSDGKQLERNINGYWISIPENTIFEPPMDSQSLFVDTGAHVNLIDFDDTIVEKKFDEPDGYSE